MKNINFNGILNEHRAFVISKTDLEKLFLKSNSVFSLEENLTTYYFDNDRFETDDRDYVWDLKKINFCDEDLDISTIKKETLKRSFYYSKLPSNYETYIIGFTSIEKGEETFDFDESEFNLFDAKLIYLSFDVKELEGLVEIEYKGEPLDSLGMETTAKGFHYFYIMDCKQNKYYLRHLIEKRNVFPEGVTFFIDKDGSINVEGDSIKQHNPFQGD